VVKSLRESALPLDLFIQDIARKEPVRVPGTAIFLTSDPAGVPPVMLHHLKHNKVLHQRVVILSLQTRDYPTVDPEERLEIKDLGYGIWQVVAFYGFMETPDMHDLFAEATAAGLVIKMNETSFFLGRETLLATGKSKLAMWRKQLYIVMARTPISNGVLQSAAQPRGGAGRADPALAYSSSTCSGTDFQVPVVSSNVAYCSRSWVTTLGSASVVVSPSPRPSAMSLRSRRMILPLRVLGRSAVKKMSSGFAIAPIFAAT
jgi:hypothetical protein